MTITSQRYLPSGPRLALVAALAITVAGCCHHKEEIPCYCAEGLLGDTYTRTCVDSPLAQYYMQNYRNGQRIHPPTDTMIDEVRASLPPGFPSREQLQYIANNYSCDFATLLLAEKIVYEDFYGEPFRTFYFEEMQRVAVDPYSEPIDVPPNFKDVLLVVVPGALWQTRPELNGSFGIQRAYMAQFGWKSCVIPTIDVGVVETNACIVANAIRALRAEGKEIVLFSASRGGAEVYHALGNYLRPEETTHILGWINVVGTPRGTPLADEFTDPPLRCITKTLLWVKHLGTIEAIDSMRADVRGAAFARTPALPPHLAILNYVAVPLSGHILEANESGYKRLRKYGPNDGVTLVRDAILEGHPTLGAMGFDHHLKEPNQREKSLAVLRAMFRYIHWRDLNGLGRDPLVQKLPQPKQENDAETDRTVTTELPKTDSPVDMVYGPEAVPISPNKRYRLADGEARTRWIIDDKARDTTTRLR